MGNPVREKKWYREWLAWRIPGLRVLDFQRIRDKVRHLHLHFLRAAQTRQLTRSAARLVVRVGIFRSVKLQRNCSLRLTV